jgi:hypothetical protein
MAILAKSSAILSRTWNFVKTLALAFNKALAEPGLEGDRASWEHENSIFQPREFGGSDR